MAKHRKFSADRFLDKLQGNEPLLRQFLGSWDGALGLSIPDVDIPKFKEYLANGNGDKKDEMVEKLYRIYDLCTDRGHIDLIEVCKAFDYAPDPTASLPVECLAMKVISENEEAFEHAYDRQSFQRAERFSIFRGQSAKAIDDPPAVARKLEGRLAEVFKKDKDSDRVIVRWYKEDSYTNFIIYHETQSKAYLIIKGSKTNRKVAPTIFRPAQQDFISYDHKTGQVEIEARFEHEEETLKKYFAECCLGDENFFSGTEAANRFDLSRISAEDFSLSVDGDDQAILAELHFSLMQKHGPSLVLRSKNVLESLESLYLRKRIAGGGNIRKAVIRIVFPDDKRGKRIELSGTNKIKFRRETHAVEVFRYLRKWTLLND